MFLLRVIASLRQWIGRLFKRWFLWFTPGRRGERLAVRYLKKQGYRIVAINLNCGRYEIDILARGPGGVLVVVEVKTSINVIAGAPPELRADTDKWQKLTKATYYMTRRYKLKGEQIRFDLVAIELPKGVAPVVRHIPGAWGQGMKRRR